ncbi:formate--tetrahydrofolate ligase [Candidatus Desulforudis audaxviator]|uniref:Formate--tetrahydrofolate ligase n=1 Tax=Desulforudis audaxviator (strain MP104C) TaxID=477974 RepID=B1I1G1_DESAP|nr:formate--tetrahydrofolate ligase [Candidatus Desulforudis audaxviator]ACA58686.1 Formate--tetrahydrofolate ligase [Candidatus Desulforudis audaxviator MP104C]AZK58686.1 Formate--tetrahydrofolate ligase [Candidatus Desulforudis audaxviator]
MLSDIEIAQRAKLKPIIEVARDLGLAEEDLELYGKYKAKVDNGLWERLRDRPPGKLIFTTAITPTPAGEGKTCTAIGLTQALGRLGKKVTVCLREPSMGPTFGVKGGAAGGGYSQVLPMEDINLHFTGDIHAVTAAHNVLAAVVDNHIFQGNSLNIDPKRVLWRRVVDVNDRQLRNVVCGLGNRVDGIPRESGFDITVASEIMALLCLAEGLQDFKERVGNVLVAYTRDGRPVFARDLKVAGALAVIMKDALKPNLVQTVEGQPAFVHGGPFANIAHGNNSILATRLALRLADYVVTEGGFGSDLGAEKFFDIVCGYGGFQPDAVVLVATVRALKMHGGLPLADVTRPDVEALGAGLANLDAHIDNVTGNFNLPVVVAVNRFPTDAEVELNLIREHCLARGIPVAVSEVVARGGEGGLELAEKVLAILARAPRGFRPLYDWNLPIREKIDILARRVYGADGVVFTDQAQADIETFTRLGFDKLPICMAKTQSSLSDNPRLLGRPKGWLLTVREVRASVGSGFLVALAGKIMTMPGLPQVPAAEKVDIDPAGNVVGLF